MPFQTVDLAVGDVILGPKEWASKTRLSLLLRRPDAERPLILLSHVLLQEGRDWLAAERALRRILHVNADNAEARNNLEVLLRRQRQG